MVPDGIAHREVRQPPDGTSVFIFSIPYFVASKLEAVKNRGGNDLRFSHDLEDILFVLSGASQAKDRLVAADKNVKRYLQKELRTLLKNPLFREAVEGTLAARGENIQRAEKIIKLLQEFTLE